MKTLFLQDSAGLLLNKKDKILYFLLVLFFFSLYAPGITWLYNVCMWLFFVYSFFYNPISEKLDILKKRKEILLVIVFFLLNLLSALFSDNKAEGISFVGLRLSLLAIPLAVSSIIISTNLKERIILGFAIATTVAAIGSLSWSVWESIKYSNLTFLYNDNLSAIINLQSIYFALLVNIAIFSFVFLMENKSSLINIRVVQVLVLVLFITAFLLASRNSLIILCCGTIILVIRYIVRSGKVLYGLSILLVFGIGALLLLYSSPKITNRFKELSYTKFQYDYKPNERGFNAAVTEGQWNGVNQRIAIWECAVTVIKNNIIFGTGLGDKKEVLKKQYAEKNFQYALQTGRNTHNNYLDILMSMGVMVLIVFLLAFFILPITYCIKYRDWYGMAILISFMLALLTENYMDRTFGNTVLAFFIAFIASYKKPEAVACI